MPKRARAGCTIVIEQLSDGRYRATWPPLPDCEAVAPTEREARAQIEDAIDQFTRSQSAKNCPTL